MNQDELAELIAKHGHAEWERFTPILESFDRGESLTAAQIAAQLDCPVEMIGSKPDEVPDRARLEQLREWTLNQASAVMLTFFVNFRGGGPAADEDLELRFFHGDTEIELVGLADAVFGAVLFVAEEG